MSPAREYTCDGPAQFLVDACLGREIARRSTASGRSRSWKPPGSRHTRGSRSGFGPGALSGALLAGAARLRSSRRSACRSSGFVRQTHDATGYGRWGLETSAHRPRAGRSAGRALRRRHRRHRRAGDLRSCSTGSPRRTGADPAGILVNWNHTHLSVDRRSVGRRVRRAARSPSATRGSGGSRTSSRTRSCRCASSPSSGSSRPARSGAWGTPSSPSTAVSVLPTGRRSSAGTRTSSSTTRSRRSSSGARTRASSRRWSATAAIPSRPATTCTSTPPTSPGRCATSCVASPGGEVVFLQGAGGNVLPTVAFTGRRERGGAHGHPPRDRGSPLARGALRDTRAG